MSGDGGRQGNTFMGVAEGFWWIQGSSWQPSDGHGIAINVVLVWPTPIRRPSPCPRPTIGAGEKLKA